MDAEVERDLASFGVEVEVEAADQSEVVEVFSVNWQSFLYFLACETQWRTAVLRTGLVWTGIDYTAAMTLLAGCKRKVREQLFADLRFMESVALEVWAKERD